MAGRCQDCAEGRIDIGQGRDSCLDADRPDEGRV